MATLDDVARLASDLPRSPRANGTATGRGTSAARPAVLIQLPEVSRAALRDALTDAWLACAPPPLAARWIQR